MKTFVTAVALVWCFAGTPAMAEKPGGHEPLFEPMAELPCDVGVPSDAFGLNERGDAVGYCGDWAVMWPATREGYGPPRYLGTSLVNYADGQPVAAEVWYSAARGINERGQIAAYVGVGPDGYTQPAIFQHGVYRLLPPAPWDVGGSALAINDRGDAVGGSGGVPVFWRRGQFIELPTPWGNGGLAYSVNNAGEVVGWAFDADFIQRPVLWRPQKRDRGDGNINWDLVVLDLSPGYARVISDSGHIGGIAGPDFNVIGLTGFPMAWDVDGGRTVLHPLAGVTVGAANGVNERGERVGYIGINGSPPYPVAVYWRDEHADPVGLGSIATDGSGFGFARAINGRGDVVGLSGDGNADGGIIRAFFVKHRCDGGH
jgi:uncharacterized membrane protein